MTPGCLGFAAGLTVGYAFSFFGPLLGGVLLDQTHLVAFLAHDAVRGGGSRSRGYAPDRAVSARGESRVTSRLHALIW
jgi:hypothetical protein